ncbi:ABC transporter substrate-binding protein/permease [Gemmata sp. JC717]|uniref:ABC transporter substrate-binding protein/permease n=1 Tax=Gemmata algarum TaxID=2975278 RepID=UPI0021BB6160|nr:ABC transporter substrate-binding protein/permease [Gemmata algarum]MDY3551254.1 ABC transporter substrate-binding protein/permease [Gemmata algarum]
MNRRWLLVAVAALALAPPAIGQEKGAKELRWGTDPTGGGPYIYKDDPNGFYVGFEVEFAEYLAKKLGRTSTPVEAEWSTLPELLDKPRAGEKGIDIVLNGYEARDDLKAKYAATVPYYQYRLQLVARKDDEAVTGWPDLGPQKKRIGVLEGSVAFDYCNKRYPGQVVPNKDVATMFNAVADKTHADVTVQDNPACVFYVSDPQYKDKFKLVDDGRQPGAYVIYLRKDDKELQYELDNAIKEGLKDGTLRKMYKKYGIWNADQEWLCKELTGDFPPDDAGTVERAGRGGAGTLWPLIPQLVKAAGMTIFLAVASFPLAMLAGVVIAVGRVYGPGGVRVPFAVYVEVVRGTPLLLQLYFLFFILPKWLPFIAFDPLFIGVLGLAINYAAYEAENYRAGILSVPRGQMEAALALGMTPFTAIRTVIVPQAARVVIPPVTNDFIALFKDTSVCSVILITELTRKYNELYNFNRDLVVELAFLTAGLYLLMSYPLAVLARVLERRLGTASGGSR